MNAIQHSESLCTTSQLHHDEQAGRSNNGNIDPTTGSPIYLPASDKPRKAKSLNNGRSYANLDGNEMSNGDKRFIWGPEKTAAEIMSIANGWCRAWEMDEAAWK